MGFFAHFESGVSGCLGGCVSHLFHNDDGFSSNAAQITELVAITFLVLTFLSLKREMDKIRVSN